MGLGIPLLELLERFSGKPGVGFYPVTLNESREDSQPRRLEKPKFRDGKMFHHLNWTQSELPASEAPPRTTGERDKGVFIPFAHESFWVKGVWVVPVPRCVALCKLPG